MEYLAGLLLALAVSASATLVGFDRDRAFYPTVMVVIASYYGLFAVMGSSTEALIAESVVLVVFLATSVLGFKRNLWLLVGALFAHGIFDLTHGHFINNPGVPVWWPMFCLTYDVTAAGYLAWLLRQSRVEARSVREHR
jgi:hypothetical protein